MLLDKIIQTIEADTNLKGKFYKGVLRGVPPRNTTPLVSVMLNSSIFSTQSYEDLQDSVHTVNMTVYAEKVSSLNINNYNQQAGYAKLQELIEGRDDNYNLKPKTLVHAILKNRELGDDIFISPNVDVSVEYGNQVVEADVFIVATVSFSIDLKDKRINH